MNTENQVQNPSSAATESPRPAPPRCPKCGFVICEQFDTERINDHAELATPNGTYTCYTCTPLKVKVGHTMNRTKEEEYLGADLYVTEVLSAPHFFDSVILRNAKGQSIQLDGQQITALGSYLISEGHLGRDDFEMSNRERVV